MAEFGYHQCLGVVKPGTDEEKKCTNMITYRFAICSRCEQEFGNVSRFWPEWLRDNWNAEQRRRRRVKKQYQHEINFTDLEYAMSVNSKGEA